MASIICIGGNRRQSCGKLTGKWLSYANGWMSSCQEEQRSKVCIDHKQTSARVDVCARRRTRVTPQGDRNRRSRRHARRTPRHSPSPRGTPMSSPAAIPPPGPGLAGCERDSSLAAGRAYQDSSRRQPHRSQVLLRPHATGPTRIPLARRRALYPRDMAIIVRLSCAARNRVRPIASGFPRCPRCKSELPWVVEADAERFDVDPSAPVPVVVDFWAAWCRPCRMISPVVEDLAGRHAGRLTVVKVDVDANPGIAERFGGPSRSRSGSRSATGARSTGSSVRFRCRARAAARTHARPLSSTQSDPRRDSC